MWYQVTFMIKVIEDFLPEDIQNNLEELMKNEVYFPWFFNLKTAGYKVHSNYNTIETPQLVHQFMRYGQPNSEYFKDAFAVMENLEKQVDFKIPKKKEIMPEWDRIKANCLFPHNNYKEYNFHPVHQDKSKEDNHYTFLYYVNDSDGDTRFWSENDDVPNMHRAPTFRYTPKKGTGVLFPSETWHCSSNPISSDYRMVINYVFKPIDK